jgi:hypothetical protein
VPQPAAETGGRHLQVGLEGSQKVDVLLLYCWFFPVTFLELPRPKYHRELRSSCLQDSEVIGWAELCERKKLTAGSCFQLQWLGHRGSEECDACVLVVGWIWLENVGKRGYVILTSDVLSLICPAEDMHGLVPEIQRCQLHSSEACQVLQLMTFSKYLKDVKYPSTKIKTYFIHLHSSPAETSESREKPRPTAAAPLCELQGPHGRHGAPAHLRAAAAGILTLTSGELRISGCLGGILFGYV